MKICIFCQKKKSLSDFYKRKDSLDGHRNDCISCSNKRSKEYKKFGKDLYYLKVEEERKKLLKKKKKRCTYCKQIKDLFEFEEDLKYREGYRTHCKGCRKEIGKEYNKKKNPSYYEWIEERKILVKENKKRCTICKHIKILEDFPKDNRKIGKRGERCNKCRMEEHYKQTYGISKQDFCNIVKKQNYKCKLCNRKIVIGHNYKKGVLFANLDHCHKTQIVRGVLCNECNQGLGKFKDDIDLLKKAIKYLKNNGRI